MDKEPQTTGWQGLSEELGKAFAYLESTFLKPLFQPWGQIQVVILLAILGICHLLARRAEPRFEEWVRNLETTRGRLRVLAILLRRLRLAFFVIGAWIVVMVMRAMTWPSRSYLISIVASVATAWLVVSLVAKLVRNQFAARLFTYSAWILAALYIIGALPVAINVLDAAAISVGDLRISLLLIVKAALVLAVLLWAAGLISTFTENRVGKIEELSPSMRVLTGKLVRIALFTIAIIIGLQSIGFNLTGLTVFSGAVGVGIGFGLQKVVSNLISGVILLLDKSIKPGDVIEVGNSFGWIQTLGARYASVVTRDGREYLIPNEDLITQQVVNWSHSNPRVRIEVTFGVSYAADPHLVRRIAVEAAQKPKRVLGVPKPVCHLTSYGESSIDFVLRFWIADPSAGVVNIKGEVLLALWDTLKENGIEIPYPHRDVQIRSPVEVTMAEKVQPKGPGRASARKR